jgi:transcriptional regulator with XRE-family HTH domain
MGGDTMSGISDNIRRLIESRNMTQSQLAEILGVSNGTLSDWLKGRFYPRHKYIAKMSEYFGVGETEITKEKDIVPTDDRLMSLYNSLTDEKKAQAIDYLRYLVEKERG